MRGGVARGHVRGKIIIGIREERGIKQHFNMVRMLQLESPLVGLPAVAVVWDPPDAAGRKTRYFRHLPSALSFLVGWLCYFSRSLFPPPAVPSLEQSAKLLRK